MTIEHIELTQAYEATPAALADVAAEAIRALNHATVPGTGRLVHPSDVYDVIGSLERLAAMLPQAFGQLSMWLGHEALAGRVVADFGSYTGRTDEALAIAGLSLGGASGHALHVVDELKRAHGATAGWARDGWIGFDTAHFGDWWPEWPSTDPLAALERRRDWTLELVIAETESLAAQVKAKSS